MNECVAADVERVPVPVNGGAGRAISPFDPGRFGHLSDAEILRRIGALLAKALIRSGRLARPAKHIVNAATDATAPTIDPVELIPDPAARRIEHFLRLSGPATPAELATRLEIKRRTLARKLHLLRTGGLCEVTGQTRNARYAVRTDFAAN